MTTQLAFCIDDNFAPYLAACLASIKAYSSAPINANIIGKLNIDTQSKLLKLTDQHFSIRFIETVPDYSHLSISERYGSRLNQITYWRLALAELLSDLDKILFLDADTLVVSDITPLWNIDISDVYAAVVSDHSLTAQQRWQELSLAENSYFNAGVMLINLKLWRRDSLKKLLLDAFYTKAEWDYNDQDVLNVVLSQKVNYISPVYNAQTYTLTKELVTKPVIVHFTGQEKPWHASSAHPYTDLFRQYLDSTPYSRQRYELVLDLEDKKIIERLQHEVPSGGTIVVWGAGMRGRRLVLAIQQQLPQYEIKCIIDSFASGSWANKSIYHPEQLDLEGLDALIVASIPSRAEIIRTLGQTAFPVI